MTTTRRAPGTPGRLSRWIQLRANAGTIKKIRAGKGSMMGMELLVLHTVGKRSGQARTSPLAWFDAGDGAVLVVGSGGGSQNPDWYANLLANPARAAIQFPGAGPVPVGVHVLDDAERERAWPGITRAAPTIGRHQARSDRTYPVVRLTPRDDVPAE